MALYDVQPDLDITRRLSGENRTSGRDFAALRAARKAPNPLEEWEVAWTRISATELATLEAAKDAAGGSGSLAWKRPGESTATNWKIQGRWETTANSANDFDVRTTLRFLRGV